MAETIDVSDQVQKFKEFLELNYLAALMESIRLGNKTLTIDFQELAKFDTPLAEILLEQPEEVIKAAELAIGQFDFAQDMKDFQIRLSNLPNSQKAMIRNIRSKHLRKLLTVEGTVRNKSDVRPEVTIARFECPSCGNVISVPQLDVKFREPNSCSCGRKGKFRVLNQELVDAQGLILEEAAHDLEGGEQPKRLNVFLKGDLVSPMSDKRTNPGSNVKVIGILKEVPIAAKDGGKLKRFDLVIDANNIEPTEEDFSDLAITLEDEKQINELATDPKVLTRFAASIAPDIYGYDEVKKALVLQLMGGVKKKRRRSDIHILLIGDPSAGKSAILKSVLDIAPKARYAAGQGASGKGLTAAVIKDEFLKGWSLEAGALVLANKGICLLDEMDKMSAEDTNSLHEGMEQQTVSISKANIQATLRCETSILAAANPKHGRFDPYGSIPEQINLPPTLISRFDLIFPIKDLPSPEKDDKMSDFILDIHQNKTQEAEVPKLLLRKYVAYAKKINPIMTDEARAEIKAYYLKMRSSGSQEGELKSVPIAARQLEALIRLTEASARLRLSDKATKQDAEKAIKLVNYCLLQIGVDPDTGKVDIDRITSGITTSQRNKAHIIREILRELEKTLDPIPLTDLLKQCDEKNIDSDAVESILSQLKQSGDLFEPRAGFLKLIH